MTDAVKLLTEAEAIQLCHAAKYGGPTPFVATLRERGLIAPEPVDPLLIEAREIGAAWGRESGDHQMIMNPDCWRDGENDQTHKMTLILAALKRGMEMRPPLTREILGRAYNEAATTTFITRDEFIDALHAALTKDQS